METKSIHAPYFDLDVTKGPILTYDQKPALDCIFKESYSKSKFLPS
ncbi:hypothetical protein LEP1GSC125_3100 [Leptospira mayottensis 200901122]|uniref:Uncharacterized protein n=1 Tax=Leptospira mayottensis 200901122 TaxID=1193010 RepID=A0AA87MP11_9LEPT|nr:hypothetical protein LEP1GSC125_3100 [Leptospira mayottensis 200901122]